MLHTETVHTAQAYVPEIVTKDLALARCGDQRKIRLSTNFLPLMGFEAGTRHSVEVLGGNDGLRLAFDANGPQKVYRRQYKTRRNSPFEAVVEIQSKSILDAAIPSYIERVHCTLRHGEVIIRPLPNRTFAIRRRLKAEDNPFAAFVAMTSGVDARCLQDTGFFIDSVLEYRPRETRDQRDLTETGALSVLANVRPRVLVNEDISTVDWGMVEHLMRGGPQISVLHVSLQCDDFSNVKAKSLKERSIENLSTTHDLVFDALRMVETVRPACVMLENVAGFASAPEGQLFKTKLRKWGYHVTERVLRAPEFGGRTRRERYYLVASIFPGFEMPEPTGMRTSPVWEDLEHFLPGCRDVSHTKSLQDGLVAGRARLLPPEALAAPTLLKSQSRQAKDSLYIAMPDGTYRIPSLPMQQALNGIPDDFDFSCVSGETASEIIGQSIEWPLHHAVCTALHKHIGDNVGHHSVVSIRKKDADSKILVPVAQAVSAADRQLSLI